MSFTVLITNQAPEGHFLNLHEIATLRFADDPNQLMPREEVLRLAKDVDAIINQGELRVDDELLEAAPKLRIVANVAIGTDNLNLKSMTERGIWGTNAPDAFTDSTADCALALLLAVTRKVAVSDRYIRTGAWPNDGFQPVLWEGPLLSGLTIGIIGYGKIGQAVAKRAEAFGMRVIYHRRRNDGGNGYRSLTELLCEADVVSLHMPLTADTHHLIDTTALASMKRGAYVINLARGPVINEAALIDALTSGHLAGAGLDVFENEPTISPALFALPNVVLTPHIGGAAVQARQAARVLAAENVRLVMEGQRPKTAVNDL